MKTSRRLIELLIVLSVMAMFISVSGCNSPTPYSAIPKVIMYYAGGESKVFVTGENYMYEYINITINNMSVEANYSYGITHSTENTSFHIIAWVKDNITKDSGEEMEKYIYTADVWVEFRENTPYFHITDVHHSEEVEKESPYQTLMERAK